MSDVRRQPHDNDEGSDSGYTTRGGATSSTAVGTASPRVRPYPQRNGRRSNPDSLGQSGQHSGRNARSGRDGGDGSERRARGRRHPLSDSLTGDEFEDSMDVDTPQVPAQTRGPAIDTVERGNDVQQLLRAWQNERHAPDILPACDELLSRVLDSIRRQTDITNTLRNADVMLSEEEHYCTTLVQTEVERVKFVVRSYVRTRLAKIEQYAAHITMNPDIHTRLTKAELRHAQRYAELIVSQFKTTVLAHLPEPQRGLDDDATPAVPSMISTPDKNKPVFFRALEGIEGLLLDDGTISSVLKDAIMLIPYRVLEQHLLRDEVELV